MEMVKACGPTAFITILLGFLALACAVGAIAAAALAKNALRIAAPAVALLMSLAVIACGGLGMALGYTRTDQVAEMPDLSATMREQIREQGHAEAQGCLTLGAGIGALPLLLSSIALVVGLVRKPNAPRPA